METAQLLWALQRKSMFPLESSRNIFTVQIGGEDAFDHLFGAWYDADAAAFKGTDREVCASARAR